MDSETFKNIAAGVQSIVVSGGLIAAGGWAIWNFKLLNTRKTAQAQLNEIEKRLKEWGEIRASVEAWQIDGLKQDEYIVAVKMKFENTGNRYVKVVYPDHVCSAAEIDFNQEQQIIFKKIYYVDSVAIGWAGELVPMKSTASFIEPNGTNIISAIFKVDNPGTYIIQCKVEQSKVEVERMVSEGLLSSSDAPSSWSDSIFVTVK